MADYHAFRLHGAFEDGTAVRLRSDLDLGAAEIWVSNPERPGRYYWVIWPNSKSPNFNGGFYFTFDNPDTAFEFKMRWG